MVQQLPRKNSITVMDNILHENALYFNVGKITHQSNACMKLFSENELIRILVINLHLFSL